MQFPRREAEVVRLAEAVAGGIKGHPEFFPTPFVPPEEIEQVLAEYNAARDSGRFHVARAHQTTVRKRAALRRLRELVRPNLDYARHAVGEHDGRLGLIGWAPPRKPRRHELEVPGQVLTVQAQEGVTSVKLTWQPPRDGGPVAAYRIQRRHLRDGRSAWTDVGSAVETNLTLEHQETGVELEYRVLAMNQAGDGPVSNMVRVVL